MSTAVHWVPQSPDSYAYDLVEVDGMHIELRHDDPNWPQVYEILYGEVPKAKDSSPCPSL